MTTITASPHLPGTYPAVPGGFSREPHPVAAARPRGQASASADGCARRLFASPVVEEERPTPRVCDHGAAAMLRLRHPFAVAA